MLQLCPAEQFAPQWYSASDGFQPKPISEIFTTENSFSSEKPIVVNQFSSGSNDPVYSSSPVQSESPLSQTYPTVAMPAGALYKVHLTQLDPLKPINVGQQKYESIVPFIQTIPNTQPGYELKQVAEMAPFRPDEVQPLEPKPTYASGLPFTSLFEPQKTTFNQPQMQTTVYQPPQTQSTIFSTPPTTFSTTPPTTFTTTPYTTFSTTPATTPFSTTPSTPFSSTPFTTYNTPQQTFRSTPPTTFSTTSSNPANPSSPTFRPPNSNYILIYQQAPQSFQTYPTSPEVTIRQSTPTTVNLPPRTEFSTTRPTTISTTPMPPFTSTKPVNRTSTMSTSSVKVTASSNFGIANQRDCVKYSLCRVSTTVPLPSGLNKKATGIGFPLKIRVVAPLGSITNVNINPATTTKRPVTKKTKRPTTRRTSKPKKNNYDRCLDGCKKVRDPICAAPLSHITIDPKTLRGFPSVCHMACHNSYREERE